MTLFNPDDYYVIGLTTARCRPRPSCAHALHGRQEGPWTGWKVKVDYWAKDHNGSPTMPSGGYSPTRKGEQYCTLRSAAAVSVIVRS
jgi:hypothetical protein